MRTPIFIATLILLHLPFNQLLAQQNGYFGTWERDFGITQVWQEVNSFEEWKTLNENYSQDGFIPTDFETYQVNGVDKYFGVWQSGTGKGYWWFYWTTMENWMNTNNDLVENQEAVLADFEKFNIDGQDWYFGIWHTGNKKQQIRIADNLEEWTSINENMLNNENLKLADLKNMKWKELINTLVLGNLGLGSKKSV